MLDPIEIAGVPVRMIASHDVERTPVLIKQARHRFFRSGAADGFRDQGGDRERADVGRVANRLGGQDRVGDDQFLQPGGGDAGRGAAGQHAVADVGVDFLGAVGEQRVGGIHQRAAGIHDVVDQDTGISGGVADHIHDFGFAGAFAAFVDDRQRRVDALGEAARPHHAADDRRNASVMIKSSIRWSLAGNDVDWMMKASEPRTFSWISTKISMSAKRRITALASVRPSPAAISCASAGLELPATSLIEPFLADIDASPRALLDTTFSISSPYRTSGFRWARRYQAGGLAGNP